MRKWSRVRTLAVLVGLAMAASGAAAPVSWASPVAPAWLVRVRVEGIARNGQHVKVFAQVFSTNAVPIYVPPGRAVAVPTGVHWIGAEIDTPGPGNVPVSATLVMRRVRIKSSRTVLLDARPGRLVRFSLDVPGVTDSNDQVQACVGGNFIAADIEVSGSPGTVYVAPLRSAIMTFGFGSFWQGHARSYLIAGGRTGGIPARPAFRALPSGMAKITLQFRAGTTVGGYNNANLMPHVLCAVGFRLGLSSETSAGLTEHVTAGRWTVSVLSDRANWLSTPPRLAARHSYTDVFGEAVWGPSTQDSPQANGGDGGRIIFLADSPFTDPAQPNGFECCDKSSITLSFHGHVLKHEVLAASPGRAFIARTRRAGWYTMAIKAWRWTPGVVIPVNLLSRTETVTWRFYAAPRSTPSGEQKELPVRVARIVALGLNIDNQAAAGGTTPVRIQFVEPHGRGFPRAPRYSVRTARLLASFDGGKTWQAVPLTRHRHFWLANVQDPASGFVALRSIVTDSRGDRSEQTIYQAYAIG